MDDSKDKHHATQGSQAGHETTDVNVNSLGLWIGLFFVFLVAVAGLVKVAFKYYPLLHYGEPGIQNQFKTPDAVIQMTEPQLQPNPGQELRDLRAEEDTILNGYGWVNKESGIVRIPIEQAMELVAQRAHSLGSTKNESDSKK